MAASESILALAEENCGILTASEAKAAGYYGGSLKYLVEQGRLCRASRGVYTLPEAWDDEFVNLQSRYKRGIFSLDTALFLCDLTDRTPHHFHMTFPQGYNVTRPKADGVRCNVASASIYPMGIVELKTPSGVLVRSYAIRTSSWSRRRSSNMRRCRRKTSRCFPRMRSDCASKKRFARIWRFYCEE